MNDALRSRFTPALHAPEQSVEDDEIDLFKLFGTLWRGKFLIALVTLLFGFAGAYYAFAVATPMYTTSATVALENRQEQVADLDSVLSGLSADQATINTEIEVMRSRGLLSELVVRADLTQDPEFNAELRDEPAFSLPAIIRTVSGSAAEEHGALTDEEIANGVIDNLLTSIRVTNVRQSYVFQITATTTDPEKSARIANLIAELYIQDQLDLKFEATEKATIWLTERTSELKSELEDAESRLKEFNATTDLVSPEALLALNRQVKELRDRLAATREAALDAEAKMALIQGLSADAEPADIAAVVNDDALTEAAALFDRGRLEREGFDTLFNRIVRRLELDAGRQTTQLEALENSIAELEGQIASQSQDLVALQQLEREAGASGLIYEHFLGRLKETSVQQGIQQADARILSLAVVPRQASKPRKPLIVAIALIIGFALTAGTVLLREMLQTRIRTSEDLEGLTGRTVMAQVPIAPFRRRKRFVTFLVEKTNSAFAEAVRNLRTTVMMSNLDRPPQVVMLASSVPGEGKTTQALSLAHNFGSLGKRVLLVEADIRRRTLAKYFDRSNELGLLAAVSNQAPLEQAVYRNDRLGIDILLGDKSKVNAADFFASDHFGTFMKTAREAYDIIVIDTPPVLAVPDARVIGCHADLILYVVRWDKTTRAQVKSGLRAFQTASLDVGGLVLSQVSLRGLRRYGYESGYGYGKGYYDA